VLPAGQEEPATAIAITPSPDRSFVEARPLVDEATAPRAPVAASRAEVTMTPAPEAAPDAGEAAAPRGAPTSDPREAPPPPERAKAAPQDPKRGSNPEGPRMSAGAGRFLTEAPPWAASAMTSNPDAGAGRFSTEPPPWAGSAWTSDPNAGAGPFETERNRR
jgi:hypothetical protein